jgi:hypothetical protein
MAPTGRLRRAFEALHWVGCTFEAALQHPKRRQIIEFVATSCKSKKQAVSHNPLAQEATKTIATQSEQTP